MLHCPKCNRIIVDKTPNGGAKVRTRMVIFDEAGAHALCPTCKTSVDIPISIDMSRIPLSLSPKHVIST
jgi:ribosomal protein S27E